MTTRQWFRVMRAELWRTDSQLAGDIDAVAYGLTNRVEFTWVRTGPLYYILAHAEEEYSRSMLQIEMAICRLANRRRYGSNISA